MNRVFTAWGAVESGAITGFLMSEVRPKSGSGEPLSNCVVPLWRIEVGSFEEAMAVYDTPEFRDDLLQDTLYIEYGRAFEPQG